MAPFLRTASALALSAVLLAGCQSSEEKAEAYYQSGLSYVEAGDVERAMIELRNVFDQDGFHKEARALYARLLMEQGRTTDAYSQLLRLVEQYPETLDARRTLAEIAISRNDWDEARRHGEIALSLAPDDPTVRAIAAAIDYRDAAIGNDADAREAAVERARALADADPELLSVRRVLIDDALRARDADAALAQIDAALAVEPESLEFHMARARLLSGQDDPAATGAQLERMHEIFPDNQEVGQALIAWYLAQENFDGAERFLRGEAGAPDGPAEGHLAVVQFLRQTRDDDAARAELDRLIAATEGDPQNDLYRALRASIDFEGGAGQSAVAEVERVIEGAEASDQTRRIKVMQARMLAQTGNEVGARARIEEVLAEDPTNVEALKLRASRLIQEDRPGAAIVDLRTALDQSPRDAETVTLMAEAHMRDGSPELAQERLSLAVQLSGNAAPESVRYARFLVSEGRTSVAEQVLTAVARPDLETMTMLGEVYLRGQKWDRVQAVVAQLRAADDPRATEVADRLEAAALLGQDRIDEGLAALRAEITGDGSDRLGDVSRLLRTQIAAGRVDEARETLDSLLETSPDDPTLKMMRAELYAVEGDTAAAETAFREILAANPGAGTAVQRLQSILRRDGRVDEADALIREAYASSPDTRLVALLEAGRREAAGEAEGAIEIYETLYEQNSNDVVVANNLASLITVHRADEADLERAFAIARRLNGSEVPAFRDTLGWIRYLRGDTDAAVLDLETAARGLPQDPTVAFHLGLAYAAAGRGADARREIERGLELAGERDVPQRTEAEEALAGI